MQYVRIPIERVPVLLGEKGSTKKAFEERTQTKLTLDETSVSIEGEPVKEWLAKDIVRAIGRGFSPEKAFLLLQEDYSFELISLPDLVGDSDKAVNRVKSRVIGTNGKTRKNIEDLSECFLSVYGKTVGIIGLLDNTPPAKEAILMLVSGSPHSSVYRFLENCRTQGRIR